MIDTVLPRITGSPFVSYDNYSAKAGQDKLKMALSKKPAVEVYCPNCNQQSVTTIVN